VNPNDLTVPATRWQVSRNSVLEGVFLAFMASAGLFYVNVLAALVNALIVGLKFSNQEAGFVAASNIYGAALGALLAIFLVKRLPWRTTCGVLFIGLLALDLFSLYLSDFWPLLCVRFVHGVVGGISVGIGLAIMARTANPDRSFGYLLLIQFGLGGLCVMIIPPLVPTWGVGILFGALMAFTVLTLLMLPFLPDYPTPAAPQRAKLAGAIKWSHIVPVWLGIFLFQAANMALNAYIIGIGEQHQMAIDFISNILGVAMWVALLGALFVIVVSQRYARRTLLLCGLVIGIVGNASFLRSDWMWVYVTANMITAICWSYCIPFFFGYSAQIDRSGQLTTATGLASKLGLASGPLVAALVVGENHYARLILIATAALITGLLVMLPVFARERKA